MKKFEYYYDEKVKTWYRIIFQVESESVEEADKKALAMVLDRTSLYEESENFEHETLFDTYEKVELADNNGFPTEELISGWDYRTGKEESIWNNAQPNTVSYEMIYENEEFVTFDNLKSAMKAFADKVLLSEEICDCTIYKCHRNASNTIVNQLCIISIGPNS
jgi:hypothetical protein